MHTSPTVDFLITCMSCLHETIFTTIYNYILHDKTSNNVTYHLRFNITIHFKWKMLNTNYSNNHHQQQQQQICTQKQQKNLTLSCVEFDLFLLMTSVCWSSLLFTIKFSSWANGKKWQTQCKWWDRLTNDDANNVTSHKMRKFKT